MKKKVFVITESQYEKILLYTFGRNKVKVYLDDIRTPLDKTWLVVRNYQDFVYLLNNIDFTKIDVISFDHDLSDITNGHEKTGYDCAKYLIKLCMDNQKKPPFTQVHSANPVGSKNIISYINNYLKHIGEEPTCGVAFVPHN